jgi:hypothetical protein
MAKEFSERPGATLSFDGTILLKAAGFKGEARDAHQ